MSEAAVDIGELMGLAPVIPVLTIEHAFQADSLARALVSGGLRVLEVTLRTPAALEAIRRIAAEVPEAVVGAGTVLNGYDFNQAVEAGARFIVSPGLTRALIDAADGAPAPLLPGVATASELMRGLDAGYAHFKFFPAETSGGAAALKALHGPFAAARFCPTGGVNAANAPAYLALPNVACVGGAWVAPKEAIESGKWSAITTLAKAASALKGAR